MSSDRPLCQLSGNHPMIGLHPRGPLGPALSAALICTGCGLALAHGFAGSRFFPATIVIDDPLSPMNSPYGGCQTKNRAPTRQSSKPPSAVFVALVSILRRGSVGTQQLWARCHTVGLEQGLGLCILAVVSVLGTWPPA